MIPTNLSSVPTADLEKEIEQRHVEMKKHERHEALTHISTLNLCGFTVKDVIVTIERLFEDEGLRFSFSLRCGGKNHDFYYGWMNYDKNPATPYPWWPASRAQDGEWSNDAFQFIPLGFYEQAENCYSFDGTDEEAETELRAAGLLN